MQDFVREQFQRKGYAAHFAIHPPDRDGDERNIHAHVLVTLRKIDEHGFARTKAEQQERYRNRGAYVEGLRDAWEKLANRHLERNGYDARIESLIIVAAEFIAPTAPPSPEQQERDRRAAEEQRAQQEAAREAAEKEARLQELLDQIMRDEAERERQARERGDEEEHGRGHGRGGRSRSRSRER
jgi:MobA/MobL family